MLNLLFRFGAAVPAGGAGSRGISVTVTAHLTSIAWPKHAKIEERSFQSRCLVEKGGFSAAFDLD
jgi:hypothetical protein